MASLLDVLNHSMITVVQKFRAGGPLMYVMLALSIIAMGFFFDRAVMLILQNLKLSPKKFLRKLAEVMNDPGRNPDQKVDEMLVFLEKRDNILSRITQETAQKWKIARRHRLGLTEKKEFLQQNTEEKMFAEFKGLEARMDGLAAIATLGPLVGLLGTVIGLIIVFEVLANSPGGVKPDQLSGGIALKLINTAGGLILAIPTLIAHGIMKFFIDNRAADIEEAAKYFVDELAALE